MAKRFVCSLTEPIVETKAGRIRGFQLDSTYTFYGVRYAVAKRFQPPQPVEPWDGVKDALSYGYVCPLLKQEVPSGEEKIPHRYWPMDEDCLNLNIWTQSLDSKAKKPVLVWLHGGGFVAGSAIEHVAYDGANMSLYGDCVVVTVNHRLNVLGYLDLSPFGKKYENSCNAGNADLVAALQWVHDNIENFGGDTENVTIFGQSGGGMKVWSLMQTPSADGLFQKGIVQSGVVDHFTDPEGDGREVVTAMMEELGVKDVEELETIPYAQLAAAYLKVSPAIEAKGGYIGGAPKANDFYVGDPRVVGFTDHAKTIPVLIGTVLGEFAFGPGVPHKYDMTKEQQMAMVEKKYGKEGAAKIADLFKKAYPGKCLTDACVVDTIFRAPTIDFIAKKSVHTEAPTYSYMFTYEFPLDSGKVAWHCAEIPFAFHNAELVPIYNTPGVTEILQERIFGAWMNFARYGNPANSALPAWPACEVGKENTMIFDTECEIRVNHDHELVALCQELAPASIPGKEDDEPILH